MPEIIRRQLLVSRYTWWLIALVCAVNASWMLAHRIRFDWFSASLFLFALAVMAVLSCVYWRRKEYDIFLYVQSCMQFVAAGTAVGLLSYIGNMLALPLIDDALIRFDRMLGFEWRDYIAWVDRYPTFGLMMSLAYKSLGVQLLGLTAALFLYKHVIVVQRFALAFTVSVLVTIILSSLWPALGGYVYYGIDPATYHTLNPAAAKLHEADILAMRAGGVEVLSLNLRGLVTFPSFHTTLGVLLTWAAWRIRWLFPIALVLNALMLLSTPVDGGHYLADTLGGIVIALAVIALAHKALPDFLTLQSR